MGAWGIDIFDNDSALDWLDELLQGDGIDFISSTLNKIKGYKKIGYIEEPDGSEILAAAETIACLYGNAGNNIPEELEEWIEENGTLDVEALLRPAKNGVRMVKVNSELRDLWEESDEFDEWVDILEDLEKRLI